MVATVLPACLWNDMVYGVACKANIIQTASAKVDQGANTSVLIHLVNTNHKIKLPLYPCITVIFNLKTELVAKA